LEVKIFWCRFNKYYAQKWLNTLWNKKDSILIASCAVTDNAKRKFIKEVKQQVKQWKHVYLTWCGAFSKNWEIDIAWFYTAYPSLLEYKDKITLLEENPITSKWKVKTGLQDFARFQDDLNQKTKNKKQKLEMELQNNDKKVNN